MKEPNDHIKKLFSDFEPEASDAKVQEGWEKVSYFLPQEKKRRGLAWFWYAGIVSGLLLLSGIAFYTFNSIPPSPEKAVHHSSSPVPSSAPVSDSPVPSHGTASESPALADPRQPDSPQPVASAPPDAAVQKPLSQSKPEDKNPVEQPGISAVAPTTTKALPVTEPAKAKASSAGSEQAALPAAVVTAEQKDKAADQNAADPSEDSVAEPIAGNAKKAAGLNSRTNSDPGTKEEEPQQKDPLPLGVKVNNGAIHAPLPSSSSPGEEVAILSPYNYTSIPVTYADSIAEQPLADPRLVHNTPLPKRFGLQVFGGPAWMFTSFKALQANESRSYNTLNASLGIAVSYYFNNSLSVMAQAGLSQSQLTYTYQSVQSQTVTQTVVPNNGVGSAMNPDTTIIYRKAYLDQTFRTSMAYQLSGGMAYNFYRKKRFDISAMLLFNFKRTNYEFSEQRTTSSQTYTVTSFQALSQVVPSNFAQPDIKMSGSITSIGLMPGLILGYSISRSFGIIVRPSYYLQLSSATTIAQPSGNMSGITPLGTRKDLFEVKQNALHLDVGIRIKW